jgi:tripartite-type tricarboxylate transporter receptor subunit TctC
VTALLRNEVQMVCLPAISVVPQVSSGGIRILAISTAKPSPLLPAVPTLKENGIDVEADAWMGLIAPAGIPGATTERIAKLVGEVMISAAIREKLAAQLMEPIPDTPAEFRARIDADMARWKPIIEAAKIKID